VQRLKEDVDQRRAEGEKAFQQKLSTLEASLQAAREELRAERELAAKAQAENVRAISELREAQTDRQRRAEAAHAEELAKRDAELVMSKWEVKCAQEQAETRMHDAEADFQRKAAAASGGLETELKASHGELRQERERLTKLRAEHEAAMEQLHKAHREEQGRLDVVHMEALAQRDREVAALRADQATASTQRGMELGDAQQEATRARQAAERRVAEADAAWRQKISEAEARSNASIELATQAKMEGERAAVALEQCQRELATEALAAETLRAEAANAARSLEEARAVAAQAQLTAEERRADELRCQVQAAAEMAKLRIEQDDAIRSATEPLEEEVFRLKMALMQAQAGQPGSPCRAQAQGLA